MGRSGGGGGGGGKDDGLKSKLASSNCLKLELLLSDKRFRPLVIEYVEDIDEVDEAGERE